MSEKIVTLNEEVIKGQLKELVRGSVEETLNELLAQEAEKLTQAARYERNEARQGYRSGHYDRNLTTTSGDVTLHVPRLKGISFETAIIVASNASCHHGCGLLVGDVSPNPSFTHICNMRLRVSAKH